MKKEKYITAKHDLPKEKANEEEVWELVNRLVEIVKDDPDTGCGNAVQGLMGSLWHIMRHKQTNITEEALTPYVAAMNKLEKRLAYLEDFLDIDSPQDVSYKRRQDKRGGE